MQISKQVAIFVVVIALVLGVDVGFFVTSSELVDENIQLVGSNIELQRRVERLESGEELVFLQTELQRLLKKEAVYSEAARWLGRNGIWLGYGSLGDGRSSFVSVRTWKESEDFHYDWEACGVVSTPGMFEPLGGWNQLHMEVQ